MKRSDEIDPILRTKILLLSGYSICVNHDLIKFCADRNLTLSRIINQDNLYSLPWVFFRLDSQSVAENLKLEEALYHCPQQLFFDLHEYCYMHCVFCPLTNAPRYKNFTLDQILESIHQFEESEIHGIGITSGILASLSGEKVAYEMIEIVQKLKAKLGDRIPIGVSPLQPSKRVIQLLKDAGAEEIRLNIEVYDPELARIITPGKNPTRTLRALSDAVEIFGHGKVSSNIILGVGETDADIKNCVRDIAQLGAIATLSPYDSFPEGDRKLSEIRNKRYRHDNNRYFGRPSYERLLRLAFEHKQILDQFSLDTSGLRTMCPYCSATHIMPGRDL